jgi:type I restriction enzyme S subunit
VISVASIAELCNVQSGGTPSRTEARYWEGNIPWVKITDMRSGRIRETEECISDLGLANSSAKVFPQGTLLLSIFATIGRTAILDVPAATNQAIAGLTVKDEQRVDGNYLRRYLDFVSPKLASQGRGAAQANINLSILRSTEIPLPSLAEQHRIAAILDKADALRVKRREAIAKLDQLVQSVFLAMFGDPVMNPTGCELGTLGDVIETMQYGPRFYNERYSANGTRIVRITDLDATGRLDFDAMPRMDVTKEDIAQYGLRPGDLIFARTGATVGKVALIKPSDPPCIAGAYFIRMRFKDSVSPEYVFNALRVRSIQTLIAVKSRQAAQQNFSGPGLRGLPMPVPPNELQNRLVATLEKIEAPKRDMQESAKQLDLLFGALQRKAFAGEI